MPARLAGVVGVLSLVLLTGCELPVAPWGAIASCSPLYRDTVWFEIQEGWMQQNVARCRYSVCQPGDSVFVINYRDCQMRLLPEGRPPDRRPGFWLP